RPLPRREPSALSGRGLRLGLQTGRFGRLRAQQRVLQPGDGGRPLVHPRNQADQAACLGELGPLDRLFGGDDGIRQQFQQGGVERRIVGPQRNQGQVMLDGVVAGRRVETLLGEGAGGSVAQAGFVGGGRICSGRGPRVAVRRNRPRGPRLDGGTRRDGIGAGGQRQRSQQGKGAAGK